MITQEEINKDYVTGAEAASVLGVSGGRIRQLCLSGRFEGAVKAGRAWLIPRVAILKHERLKPRARRKAQKEQDAALLRSALAEARRAKEEA